eukprot:scaffold113_cov339-Pavlova_lutheri.AAC.45
MATRHLAADPGFQTSPPLQRFCICPEQPGQKLDRISAYLRPEETYPQQQTIKIGACDVFACVSWVSQGNGLPACNSAFLLHPRSSRMRTTLAGTWSCQL